MIAKLIDGTLVEPDYFEKRKVVITNPNDDILKVAFGYKDVVFDEKPTFDETKQHLEERYNELDNKIQVIYEIIENDSIVEE